MEETKTTEVAKDKKVLGIVGVIVAIVILVIATISNTSEKFDIVEQLALGQKYLQELDYEQAKLVFSKVIEVDPMSVEAYIGLAKSYEGMGDINSAISTLEKGFEMTGDLSIAKLLDELRNPIIISNSNINMFIGESFEIEYTGGTADPVTFTLMNKEISVLQDMMLTALNIGSTTIEITQGSRNYYINVNIDDIETTWIDEEFETLTRTILSKPEDEIIMASDLAEVTTINIVGDQIFNFINRPIKTVDDEQVEETDFVAWSISLSGNDVEGYTIDEELYDTKSTITQFDDLKNFVNLTHVDISFTDLSNLTAFEELENLLELRLNYNNISDLSSLNNLTNLTLLELQYNENISDVTPLQELINLERLCLTLCDISDISALNNLTNMKNFIIWANNISDISVLENMTNLETLYLSQNNISNISTLTSLTKLTELNLASNNLVDISQLSNINELTELYLWGNDIVDITPLQNMKKMKILELSMNKITDISALSNMIDLEYLTLFYNNIRDISPLSNLNNLNLLAISDNNITNLTPLSNLNNIESLYVGSNNISDWSPISHIENAYGRP